MPNNITIVDEFDESGNLSDNPGSKGLTTQSSQNLVNTAKYANLELLDIAIEQCISTSQNIGNTEGQFSFNPQLNTKFNLTTPEKNKRGILLCRKQRNQLTYTIKINFETAKKWVQQQAINKGLNTNLNSTSILDDISFNEPLLSQTTQQNRINAEQHSSEGSASVIPSPFDALNNSAIQKDNKGQQHSKLNHGEESLWHTFTTSSDPDYMPPAKVDRQPFNLYGLDSDTMSDIEFDNYLAQPSDISQENNPLNQGTEINLMNLTFDSESTTNNQAMVTTSSKQSVNSRSITGKKRAGSNDGNSQTKTRKTKRAQAPQARPQNTRTKRRKLLQGEDLNKKLASLNIDPQQYKAWKRKLISDSYGYSEILIQTVVLRKSSKNTVEKLIELHHALSGDNYKLTHEQLISIASHNGGSKNLQAVQDNFQALKELHFTAEQIVSMVSHAGGSKNLQAVQENLATLQTLKFTAEQIVRMVSHSGGSKNLQAVQANFQALKELHFTAEQIVSMVSHSGGSKNLQAVKANFQALQNLHFTAEQIVRMVSHIGGSKNLVNVQKLYNELENIGKDNKEIVEIFNKCNGENAARQALICLDIQEEALLSWFNELDFSGIFENIQNNATTTETNLMIVDGSMMNAQRLNSHGLFSTSSNKVSDSNTPLNNAGSYYPK